MSRRALFSVFGLSLLAFVLVLAGLNAWPGQTRIDLTENKLHTLGEGSKQLLSALESPVSIQVYFSDQASKDLPAIRFFARRVEGLLEEMSRVSKGSLTVDWLDPEPFSEVEDEALLAGLTGLPIGPSQERVYFGVAIEASNGEQVVLPFLSPQREHVLEYELLKRIDRVQRAGQPRIAVVTDLPIQSWVIYEQMASRYELIEVPATAKQLPSEVDLILIIQPSMITEELANVLEAAIDRGQRFLVFIDPLIQTLPQAPALDPKVFDVLEKLGVVMQANEFVADASLGLQVTLEANAAPIRHPAILGLSGRALAFDDVITSDLEAINVATVGHLETLSDINNESSALWVASGQSARFPVTRLLSEQPVEAMTADLLNELPSMGGDSLMALRIRQPTDAVVVADVDFMADRYWVSRQNFLGTELMENFASNGAFVLNAIDNLIGDPSLIAIRSRERSLRPFDLVDELRRSAEVRLLDTEQRLEAALAEADEQLSALRSESPEDMSEAQRAELSAFIEARLELRQDLRRVRRNLDQEIDQLGRRLTWVNILLMPFLVAIFGLGLRWQQGRARTQR
ncbi:MAG TPA: GldG family protein [Wenzhouxiangella sp.]